MAWWWWLVIPLGVVVVTVLSTATFIVFTVWPRVWGAISLGSSRPDHRK